MIDGAFFSPMYYASDFSIDTYVDFYLYLNILAYEFEARTLC